MAWHNCLISVKGYPDRLVSIYSWVRSTRISIYFGFDLHKIPISNCPLFDLHEFWSAQFSICTVFALQFLDLQRFRSAQYSICTDFDLHGFRSTCISICKSILDLWIFRSANQISIYRFFDLQIKFRSTDFSICKSSFDLQIFRSANQVSIYRFFHLQIKFHNQLGEIHTMPVNIHIYPQPRHSNL